MVRVATCTLLLTGNNLFAKATIFKNAGLKNEIVVTLEVVEKTATGSFTSHAYDEDAGPATPCTGKEIAMPNGKRGVYLEIRFAGPRPYSTPPDNTRLIWYLKIVNRRAHLFIPMQERDYTGKTPRWVVANVELEPQAEDAPNR